MFSRARQRREVAVRGPLIAFCILVAVGLVGARLLELLGISRATLYQKLALATHNEASLPGD